MIIKSYEINKINLKKNNIYLLYGENEGFKNKVINDIFKKFSKNIYKYDEKEILNNKENFFNKIFSKSFFEKEKLIIILRSTEKIVNIIEEIIEKNIVDTKIILLANILEKKSKLRILFEKNKNIICIPFYADNIQTLSNIANTYFKEKKIPISQETINILVARSRGDRLNLNNEITKIENFIKNKKKINIDDILKLTNLAENYSVTELVDSCLSKNSKKTINILNENNYSAEDCILIIKTFLIKAKRLNKLQSQTKENKNIDQLINSFKPPIFWKDKEIVKEQIKNWTLKKVENLIYKINEIELLIKKNSSNSINILFDFIITQSNKTNN
jgi:DNA polymerase-3 subunit delta